MDAVSLLVAVRHNTLCCSVFSIRVSFYLGAGNIRMAKKVGWITVSILGMQGIVVAAVFAFARRQIPYLFTHDPVVVHQAEQLMLLVCASVRCSPACARVGLAGFAVVSRSRAVALNFCQYAYCVFVKSLCNGCLQLAAAFLMIALFFTAMAILQGQARPSMIAVSFVIGAWIVGVPLAYVFCHVLKLVSCC